MSEILASDLPGAHSDIEEFRRPILTGLCLACMGAVWLWLTVVGVAYGVPSVTQLIPPALLLIGSLTCLALATSSPRLSHALLLLGMSGCLVMGYHYSRSPNWLYYQALVVIAAGLLAGPKVPFLLAALFTASTAVDLASSHSSLFRGELLPPMGMLWATAIAIWLATRSLYTALSWALESQRRAWSAAAEARERRGELRRTLNSLRLTHDLLERTKARQLVDALTPFELPVLVCSFPTERRAGALSLWGTVGVQSTFPHATPAEMEQVVKERIATVGPGGGLLIAPAHVVEPETPVENVLAFIAAVDKYGAYR